MARSNLDNAAIRRVSSDPDVMAAIRRLAEQIVQDAQDNLRQGGHVDTGALLRSSFVDQDQDTTRCGFGVEGSGVDYAEYVDAGTAAHEIRAKDDGVLAFRGRDGQMVFVKEVHHPATRPTHFFTGPALRPRQIT